MLINGDKRKIKERVAGFYTDKGVRFWQLQALSVAAGGKCPPETKLYTYYQSSMNRHIQKNDIEL